MAHAACLSEEELRIYHLGHESLQCEQARCQRVPAVDVKVPTDNGFQLGANGLGQRRAIDELIHLVAELGIHDGLLEARVIVCHQLRGSMGDRLKEGDGLVLCTRLGEVLLESSVYLLP